MQSYSDPYAILDLPRTATMAEIKQAYFAQVRAHPPERDPETFKRIRAAYERLRDPDRRAEADMLLLVAWPAANRRRRPPQLDLAVHSEDIIAAVRALTDLDRSDWSDQDPQVSL